MKKSIILGVGIGVTVLILLVGVYFLIYTPTGKSSKSDYASMSVEYPVEVSGVEIKTGEYEGDRSNTLVDGKQTEDLVDTSTGEFFVSSYASTPKVKGSKSEMWVENRSKNIYAMQVRVVDPKTNDVVAITPLLKPGMYVDNLKLQIKDLDTTHAYNVLTYLYELDAPNTLYSVQAGSVTFHE